MESDVNTGQNRWQRMTIWKLYGI